MIKKQTLAGQQPLAVINPHTAAIDVGSTLMMVSYTDLQGHQQLIETDGFTHSLHELAAVLKQAGVQQVSMESTGSYWMSLYGILEAAGFEVIVVNAGHFKNVAAQKTDVKDCQWLHQLHACGMLRASHIAPQLNRELRGYLHERNILQQQKSDTLNRIHRQLTLMNVKVQHLISDIEGVAGMKLLRAIAAGLKDPHALLALIYSKALKASPEDLLQSLEGIYDQQHITILARMLRMYDFYKEEMNEYEQLIESVLQKMLPMELDGQLPVIAAKKGMVRKNQYRINLKGYLEKMIGIDLTQIEGLQETTLLEIIAVTGIEMNKWPTSAHFTSWLNLTPCPSISGGKIIGYHKRVTHNKATQAFRLAAQTMWKNKGPLGKLYRRLAAQKGAKKAVKAVARKLAVIFYTLVKNKTPYNTNHSTACKERNQKAPEQQRELVKNKANIKTSL